MDKKPRPIRLTLIVLLLPLGLWGLRVVLMNLQAGVAWNWMIHSTIDNILREAVQLGISVWFGFRLGRTNYATWYIPILLFAFVTGTGMQIVVAVSQYWTYGNNGLAGLAVKLNYGVWFPIQSLTVQFLGCYILSRGFGVFLLPVNLADTGLSTQNTSRLSIRFLMISVIVFAVLLSISDATDRLIGNEYQIGGKGARLFDRVWMLLTPAVAATGLFGIAIWFASRKHRWLGMAAMALWLAAQITSIVVIMLYYFPMLEKTIPSSQVIQLPSWPYFIAMSARQFVSSLLTIGVLYWHGYRFVVASNSPIQPLDPGTPFDSIQTES